MPRYRIYSQHLLSNAEVLIYESERLLRACAKIESDYGSEVWGFEPHQATMNDVPGG